MILKSISIIKAPKILPKIKDFEVFVARWDTVIPLLFSENDIIQASFNFNDLLYFAN